jgi:predicted dehydrogenase
MLRVGLVGYGFMGGMHSQCYGAGGDARITAVVDVEPDRRKRAEQALGCRTYADIQAMVSDTDVDIIDVCTPTYLHAEHVIAAARAGKHIMCEKPMALDLESCDAMIGEVNGSGVAMMVGQVIRFWPEYQLIKEMVDRREYGSVRWVSARRLSAPAGWAWQNWIEDPAKSGGAIHDLHIHDLDFIAYLIGPPGEIQTRGIAGPGGGLDTALSLGWNHEGGASSYAEGSLNMAAGFPFTMAVTVVCDKGTIRFDSATAPSLVVYPEQGGEVVPTLSEPSIDISSNAGGNISDLGGYYNEIKYFTECVRAGRMPLTVTPQTAREAVRLCLAARKSAESGTAVEL